MQRTGHGMLVLCQGIPGPATERCSEEGVPLSTYHVLHGDGVAQ